MQKKFEINRTKIKGGCQSGRKVVTHYSKSDFPLGVVTKVIFGKRVFVGLIQKKDLWAIDTNGFCDASNSASHFFVRV